MYTTVKPGSPSPGTTTSGRTQETDSRARDAEAGVGLLIGSGPLKVVSWMVGGRGRPPGERYYAAAFGDGEEVRCGRRARVWCGTDSPAPHPSPFVRLASGAASHPACVS
nr:hypothetical protein GCM10020241_11710 [Streptoalloteichus tenebrarius]